MILMLAPAPLMRFGAAPSGANYVSDEDGLLRLFNNSAADQTFLMSCGAYTLTPFGGWGNYGFTLLSDLYAADTGAILPGITGFPKFTITSVFNDGGNTGTWYKTGTGSGSGNWAHLTSSYLDVLVANAAASAAHAAQESVLAAGFGSLAELLTHTSNVQPGDRSFVTMDDAGNTHIDPTDGVTVLVNPGRYRFDATYGWVRFQDMPDQLAANYSGLAAASRDTAASAATSAQIAAQFAVAMARYTPTLAAGTSAYAVGQLFSSDASGRLCVYRVDAGPVATLIGVVGYSDEMARDAIGAALVQGTGIAIAVDDAADTITITATLTPALVMGQSIAARACAYSL